MKGGAAMRTACDAILLVILGLLSAAWIILWYWSTARIYRDARAQGYPAVLIALGVFLTWPLGWLIYALERRRQTRAV